MSKMSTIKAVIIKTDGDAELIELDRTLGGFQKAVGGYIEPITASYPGFPAWTGYVDEDGKGKGLPRNFAGEEIAVALGWGGRVGGDYLVGPVLLVGAADSDLDDTDVTREVVDMVIAYYDAHGAVEWLP